MGSPLELPGRDTALPTLILLLWDLSWTSNPQSCKIVL